jgi:hypothetical protein
MLASLRSLADNLIDKPQEQNELIKQAYHSAIYLLDTVEVFEDKIKFLVNSNYPV